MCGAPEGELVQLQLDERLRPVSIIAQWSPRLGPAEHALSALLDVARHADPMPDLTRTAGTS